MEVTRYPDINVEATGEKIRKLMKTKKLDTYTLSQMLEMRSTTSIYAWTQGRVLPNTTNLVRLSQIFDCKIDDLIVMNEV